MTDMFDPETRSRIMRSVRTQETAAEERLATALRRLALRFRRNDSRVFGKPDFVFPARRLAVFVDGDFWHGRSWIENGAAPATNARFWIQKFDRNIARDRLVERRLRRNGWSVLRLWGSDVNRAPKDAADAVLKRLKRRRSELVRRSEKLRSNPRADRGRGRQPQ